MRVMTEDPLAYVHDDHHAKKCEDASGTEYGE